MSENSDQQFEVSVKPDQTVAVQVGSNKLFRLGSSLLSTSGQEVLEQMGKTLENVADRQIVIEGHSDNIPLGRKLEPKFRDNWGLSIARAVSTAKFIVASTDIAANRISVRGFGSTQPIADNSTPEGRQKNRRVEILLLPAEAAMPVAN